MYASLVKASMLNIDASIILNDSDVENNTKVALYNDVWD